MTSFDKTKLHAFFYSDQCLTFGLHQVPAHETISSSRVIVAIYNNYKRDKYLGETEKLTVIQGT